ncbi:MAG: hypothetical protein ABJA37_12015 [Ferruginibacter sp.]
MKIFSVLFFTLFFSAAGNAQQISKADYTYLQQKEDSLQGPALKIIQGRNGSDRFIADSNFTRIFIRALKTHSSFDYPFDSLITISKLYAPDSSFRIFTWQMVINENVIRQHGAIQIKTADGSLKLFPLIDKSDITLDMADTIGNNLGWMGAVYYKIILTKYKGHPFYTLLGFDENNIRSDKKIIEVLDFVNGAPVFGGRYFSIENVNVSPDNIARYVMEFKKETSPRLTYDDELEMIVMEHLVSESNQPSKKWTLVPDGDYEGFKWVNGKWTYVNKIFNQITPEGQEPVPNPILKATEVQDAGAKPVRPVKKKKG